MRNLTAIVRLDKAETINIQNRANKCSPPHPPPPKKKTIFAFLSTLPIWDMDSFRSSFPNCFSVREISFTTVTVSMRS